jgi:hypothetical protein
MDTVVGDEVGSEEIVGVAEMDEGIIHHSGPGEDDPYDKPDRENWNREAIGSVDRALDRPIGYLIDRSIGRWTGQRNHGITFQGRWKS